MAAEKTLSSRLWSYGAFLIVGSVIAYAFLGMQYSAQIAGKEAEIGSLRQQYSGLQGELEATRASQSPSQQVLQLNSCSDEKAQITSLKAELAAAQATLAQCVSEKSAQAVQPSSAPSATASAGFVGKTISVKKDESLDLGSVFKLTYFGIDSNGLAVFRLNSFSYTRAIGSFTSLSNSDGSKYVITVNTALPEKAEFVFYNG